MSTMKDIARIVAERHDASKQETEQFVSTMFELLKATLATDEQVKIKGLGTFKVQNVKERASVDVNTGERVIIDSHDRIAFTPDKQMAESVNKPFGHFETVVLNDGVVFDDIEEPTALAAMTEPTVDEEPTTAPIIEEPIVEEPTATEEPTVVEEPIVEETTVAEEPTVVEPIVEEPTVTEEPTAKESTDEELATEGNITENETIEKQTLMETETEPQKEIVTSDNQNTEKPAADEQNTEEPVTNEHNTEEPTNNEQPSSIGAAVLYTIAGLALLLAGFAIGRATADITFDDVLKAIGLKAQPQKIVVVYKDCNDTTNVLSTDTLIAPTANDKDSIGQQGSTEAPEQKPTEAPEQKPATPAPKPTSSPTPKPTVVPAPKPTATSTPKPTAKQDAKPEQKPQSAKDETYNNDQYNSDPRIRLGAYRITGVQQTVTVRSGQTLASISKAYLGPGMECYIEAINGVKEVKAGQKIKIPALKVKARKKK